MKNLSSSRNHGTRHPLARSYLSSLLRSPVKMFQIVLLLTTVVFYFHADASAAESPIPHGTVATHAGPGITSAWYACPTDRYPHGVLGDRIEGGCLKARLADGETLEVVLDDMAVFEDTTPRLADIDGDGNTDIVTVRSGASNGAALVVYGLRAGVLTEIAATPPIGIPNRWLAPAGIADFDGNGTMDIAYVETPHLGGMLRLWSIIDGNFTEIDAERGFSNHSIGESRVSLSRLLDHNDDGITDLALPTFGRGQIAIVTFKPRLTVLQTQDFDPAYFD